jgi:hypothetical protein
MPRRDVRQSEGSVHSPLGARGCLVNIALGSNLRIGVYGQDLRGSMDLAIDDLHYRRELNPLRSQGHW